MCTKEKRPIYKLLRKLEGEEFWERRHWHTEKLWSDEIPNVKKELEQIMFL